MEKIVERPGKGGTFHGLFKEKIASPY